VAKKSVTARNRKRIKLVNKYAKLRDALKQTLKSVNASYEEQEQARRKLQSLPANSSPVRVSRRCRVCGRPRAVYRKFALCRICLRELSMSGEVPGVVKSSW